MQGEASYPIVRHRAWPWDQVYYQTVSTTLELLCVFHQNNVDNLGGTGEVTTPPGQG